MSLKKPCVIDMINDKYKGFTNAQKKIAEYILNNSYYVSSMSLTEFCEMSNVSAVTANGFMKVLGYKNFAEMKKSLQNYIQSRMAPQVNFFKEFDSAEYGDSFSLMYQSILEDEIEHMEQSYRLISEESIINAVQLIKRSKRIYLAAHGVCTSVAEFFCMRLVNIGNEASILGTGNLSLLISQLYNTEKDSVFIIFSFPNYDEEIIKIAKYAKSVQAKTICFTDSVSSPAAYYSDIVFVCKTTTAVFYNSMTVPLSLCNVLSTLLYTFVDRRVMQNKDRYNVIQNLFPNNNHNL